ncbi:hypothetical protein CY35_02G110400 [Sphagnum magellanicum]|nr:hypothetical protein CY35_02G110400 [Sphagnum magellanicum]
MAVCITNRSNVLTNSSVASLERAVSSGSFLLDVSREDEFNGYLRENLENGLGFHQFRHGEYFQDEQNRWTGFFRFMPDDAGGIMSHINTLMEQEHGRLVHDWKHVDGHTHQMEQLIGNVQRFRMLCKDFRIQDREYDCLTSNFLVEKPRGLRMHEHPFFMTARMMRKLRICRGNFSVIELSDKYELLENFLLHDGGHFEDKFKLGSTVVEVSSMEQFMGSTGCSRAVSICVKSENLGYVGRVVACESVKYFKNPNADNESGLHVNFLGDLEWTPSEEIANIPMTELTAYEDIQNIAEIKLVGRVLSYLKHMSNYKDDEAQFGVIDNLYKVGCDNFIVAKAPTIHEILNMQPPNDMVLVDLSKLSDVPLIFGTRAIEQIH